MLEPAEMMQVLIHWQFRNGAWKLFCPSAQCRGLGIPLVNLYLVDFSASADTKQNCRFRLKPQLNSFLYFFVSAGNSGFFIPSFPSLSSRLPGGSGLVGFISYSHRPSLTFPVFCSIVCFLSCVFTSISFLSVKWFLKLGATKL